MARYESDFTKFMQEMYKKQPDLYQKQLEGRARLWDKQQDAALQRQFDEAKITRPDH